MACPIGELAARCKANPYDASCAPVGERPELVRFNEAWSNAVGLVVRPLGAYCDRNKPLLGLLEAFATTSERDLLRACEQAKRDDWCMGRKGNDRDQARKRDVGCVSPAVLRRLLDAADEHEAKQRKHDEREKRERLRIQAERDAELNQDKVPPPKPEDIERLIQDAAKQVRGIPPRPRPLVAVPRVQVNDPQFTSRRLTLEELDKELDKRPREEGL
jgi:hypothetical protein